MADVFSVAKRSEIMSRVRDCGYKATELALISLFRRNKIVGWCRHQAVFGSPDFAFTKRRLAVFVDGCFWHGCPKHGTQPQTNTAFWAAKLGRNKSRDRLVARTLRSRGWRVLRVWQHELSLQHERKLVRRLLIAIGK